MPSPEEDPLPRISETMAMDGPSQTGNGNGTQGNANIRRYLVLLHDCICIKFITVQQAQQRNRMQRSQSTNFHQQQQRNQCSSSSYCHCSCSTDLNQSGSSNGGGCQATSGNSCDCCSGNKKGGKCDWKSNYTTAGNEDSNDRGDHQECQFCRNQNHMGYQHQQPHVDQSQSSMSTGKDMKNDGNRENGSISSSSGDRVNHHQNNIMINNNNKTSKLSSSATPPVQNNKGGSDYDVIGNHGNQCCRCKCSRINNGTGGEWESKKHSEHHQHMSDATAKGTLKSVKDEQMTHLYSGNNNMNNRSSIMTKVDHSMQALFLYQEFRDINMNCFWNSAVHEAFKNLEYKGSIVPSTIIVGSPIRKHLTVLKTAWSRKMLRSPSGYLIDFLGEIEELIADPIGKSGFVPLQDSLCWSIFELTSSGQEAFVDDIFLNLASAFPGMALPTKELIYQTLEKLTRERKIYQTAQGYFVVTPDTHRYIMSTEPLLMQASRADSQLSAANAANFLRNTILLQQASSASSSALRPTTPLAPSFEDDALKENNNTNGTKGQENEDDFHVQNQPLRSDQAPSPDPDTYSLPYGTFRRYNSLRIRKSASGTGCLPRRTLSMRLPKSKSKNGSKLGEKNGGRQDVTGSFQNLDGSQVQQLPSPVNKQLLSRRRKHKSFLSRLLSFRGVRKSARKDKSGRGGVGGNPTPLVNNGKAHTSLRNDKGSGANSSVLIKKALSNGNNAKDEEEITSSNNSSSGGGRGGGTNLQTISTQTSFSIENLNGDLHLLSLGTGAGQSKSSTLDREDSDSGRCTDSHSDADAEIAAALNRGLTPIMHDHLNHYCPTRRIGSRGGSSLNVYEKIESDLGLKVEVDDGCVDGRSPRSPSSQMSVSPSPSTFTMFGGRGGNSHNHHYLHPNHHARHNLYSRCHSSASSSGNSYRDFYNLYRRRYPSYQQSTPTPTSLESGDNFNESVRFKPHAPIRYPPRSFERKQIFDEINRSSFREKKSRGGSKNVSICIDNNNIGGGGKTETNEGSGVNESPESGGGGIHSSTSSTIKQTSNNTAPATTTTTTTTTVVTQTLKNTTNLELEFRLPLGNIFNAAMGMNNKANGKSSSTDKLSSERSGLNETNDETEKKNTEGECTLSELNTMVNDLFTIKSFVKSNPFNDELSSTIEFKTNGGGGGGTGGCGSNGTSSNRNNANSKASSYVIEAVSSKPFADIHTKFNRESEII